MSNGWDLNFAGQTIDDVDKSGGNPPDGFYRVNVTEVTNSAEDGSMHFKFKISQGPQAGRHVKGKLSNPRFAETVEKAKTIADRAKIWAVRMGLVPKEAEGKTANVDYLKAIGKELVVKLKTRVFDGDKGKVEFQEVEYAGVYPLDHHDLDGPTRTALSLPLLPGQSATDPKAGKQTKAEREKATPGAASGAPGAAPTQTNDQIAAALFGG